MSVTTECGHGFEKPDHWPDSIEGATLDCPECNSLLIMVSEGEAKLFHKEMHRRDPRWPEDGNNTGYVDVGGTQ